MILSHFDLAAWQADDCRSLRGAGDGDRQVLNEGVEAFGHASMAVNEVEHLVEQQQHGRVCGGKYFSQ